MSIQAQNTELNIVPGGIIPVVHVSQYDVDRVLTFNLYDRNSEASLASGTTAVIEGTKPDGNGFQYAATISGNTVTVNTTIQMTVLSGTVDCKIVLRNGSQVIGTALFIMDVEKAGINENTPMSETDLPLIIAEATEQMERAEAAATAAALSETNAATSATNAATSETNAATSETNAATSEINAAASASTASTDAASAETSATNANRDALKAEGHAVGTQNGTPVTSESPYYHNNAAYWANYASQYAQGGLIYKGSILFANIPTSGMVKGDMYNIENDFTTDSRFEEGAGVFVKAGTNIAWNGNKWDVLATGGGTGTGGHTIVDESGTTYPARAKLKFINCDITDDSANDTTIIEAEGGKVLVQKPTISNETLHYNGNTLTPVIWRDTTNTTISGTYEAINIGSYTFTVALADKQHTVWDDNSVSDLVYTWNIGKPELVAWSTGTDTQIKAIVDSYYNGNITLNEVQSVWSVGDSRVTTISAIAASGDGWTVGESHRSQTVEQTIIDFDHDTLTTPIGTITKALITVQTKDCLRDATVADNDGDNNTERGYINSSNTTAGGWSGCARRAWCNNAYYNALPSAFKNLVKQAKHSTTEGNQSTTLESTDDYVFLPSEWEIYGITTWAGAQEGTQYEYYRTAVNRNKLPRANSTSSTSIYWERSPGVAIAGQFCQVFYNGDANVTGASGTFGIAPALCI